MPNDIIVHVPDTTAEEAAGAAIVQMARTLAVIDAESYVSAGTFIREQKETLKRIEEYWEEPISKAHQAHKTLTRKRAELMKPREDAVAIVSQKAMAYKQEEERKRREAEEVERRRLAKIEEERRLAEAAKAEAEAKLRREQFEREQAEVRRKQLEAAELQKRDAEAAARMRAQAEEQRRASEAEKAAADARERAALAALDAPIIVAPVVLESQAPKVDGLTEKKDWDFRIVNAALIPRQYMVPDERQIRATVKALGDRSQIPGVEVFAKITYARTGR